MKQLFLILVSSLFFVLSCKVNRSLKKDMAKSLNNLQWMMQGSYSSGSQAKMDSTYYDITLHMTPIWKDKGHFLYVEQAVTSMPDKPYRQRIYELLKSDNGTFISRVYSIEQEERFIGKWQEAFYFDNYSRDILTIREGCDVVLSPTELGYKGSTIDDHCKSSLRGATYATSSVIIEPGVVISWDQGFDADGNQVWGATQGGYIFERLKQEGISVK